MIRGTVRNLLALLALILIAISITGGCRGWYRVECMPSEPGRSVFRVEIDRCHMADDFVSAGKAILRTLSGEKTEESTESAAAK
jgi:hypothetical protein